MSQPSLWLVPSALNFPLLVCTLKKKTPTRPLGPRAALLVSRVCLDFCPLVSRRNQRQLAVLSLCCGLFFSFQDSLVAAYPTAPSDEKNNFVRSELTYFLWIHLLLFSRTTIYCIVTPILRNCGVRPETRAALQCWFLTEERLSVDIYASWLNIFKASSNGLIRNDS